MSPTPEQLIVLEGFTDQDVAAALRTDLVALLTAYNQARPFPFERQVTITHTDRRLVRPFLIDVAGWTRWVGADTIDDVRHWARHYWSIEG